MAYKKADGLPQYTVIRSSRKTIAIQITTEGQVLIRCPNRMPAQAVDAFVRKKRRGSKSTWRQERHSPALTDANLLALLLA